MKAEARTPSDPPDEPAPLGGRARVIRFPTYWAEWFSRQSVQRLDALDELVDERIERQVLRNVLRRLKHAVVAAFLGAAATAHWFSDQALWLADRVPLIRQIWHLVVGGS